MVDQLMLRGELTHHLGSALTSSEHGLKVVPGLLKRALEERAWERRVIVETGEEFEGFPNFEAYVSANPPKGLGASIDLIQRMVDTPTLDLLDQALQRPRGRPPEENVYNVHNNERPSGNNDEAALRRLRKDRPDLHTRVLAGEMSPNAAMVQAGFRRVTKTMVIDDVDALARALRRHLEPSQLEALAKLLTCQEQEA